jgi:hypothetical protein
MEIERYDFGHIIINGQGYSRDLILLPDRVISDWWRERGHSLAVADLEEVTQAPEQIDVLVIGTGAHGLMAVPPETRRHFEQLGVELIIRRTGFAVEEHNRHREAGQSVVTALHLACWRSVRTQACDRRKSRAKLRGCRACLAYPTLFDSPWFQSIISLFPMRELRKDM